MSTTKKLTPRVQLPPTPCLHISSQVNRSSTYLHYHNFFSYPEAGLGPQESPGREGELYFKLLVKYGKAVVDFWNIADEL